MQGHATRLQPRTAADTDKTRYPYASLEIGKVHKTPCLIPTPVEYLRFNWTEHLFPRIPNNKKPTQPKVLAKSIHA